MFKTLLLVLIVIWATGEPLFAQKEFLVRSRTLTAGSRHQSLVVEARSDIALYGYSFGLLFDPLVLSVTEVTWEGAVEHEPAFFRGMFDNATGAIGYGCVLDYGPDFGNVIPAGQDIALARIVVDIEPDLETTTELVFGEPAVIAGRPVKNVITTSEGYSEFPDLTPGTLTIVPDVNEDVVFLRGDSNSDRRVDLSDAIYVLDFLFSGAEPPRCLDALDGNDDGRTDLTDAIYMLGFFFAGGPPIPAPYPEPGVDPTADALVCESA